VSPLRWRFRICGIAVFLTNCAIEQAKVDGLLSQAKAWREAVNLRDFHSSGRDRARQARVEREFSGLGKLGIGPSR
jgi:hypothetical protein